MLGVILLIALVLLLVAVVAFRTDGRSEPGGVAGAILAVILLLTASVRF
jgi:hypothetical protein